VDTSNSKKLNGSQKLKTEAMKNPRGNGSHEALTVPTYDNILGMKFV
jgi:hypothetical protein